MPSEEDPIEAEKREKIPPWGLSRSLLVLQLRPALALSSERARQQIQKEEHKEIQNLANTLKKEILLSI